MAARPHSVPPRYLHIPGSHQNFPQTSTTSSLTLSPTTSSSLPSPPTNPNRLFFNNQPHVLLNPSPSDGKQLQHYFDQQQGTDASFIDTSSLPIASVGDYMSEFELQQHPGHALPFAVVQDNVPLWNSNPYTGGNNMDGVANQIQSLVRNNQTYTPSHNRTPSSSTMASQATNSSPIQSHHRLASRPRVSEQQPSRSRKFSQGLGATRRQSSSGGGSHLPTPSQTPTHDTFRQTSTNMQDQQSRRPSHGQNNSNMNHAVAASLAMNEAMVTHPMVNDSIPALSHSYSTSSQHSVAPIVAGNDQGIRTAQYGETLKPMAVIEDWIDEYLRFGDDSDYSQQQRPMVPKFERTVTDAYNDELFINTPMSVSAVANASYLTPTHPVTMVSGPLSDRLQAAQMARSTSSNSSNSRGLSPFQADSPWARNVRPNGQMRQADQSDLRDLSYQASPQTVSEPKTISPKEAMLDYKPEENEQPLFPPSSSSSYPSQQAIMATSASAPQPQYSNMGLSMATTTGPAWGAAIQSLSGPTFQNYPNFMVPNLPMGGLAMESSFIPSHPQRNPEFPAHLTTMDSSASEAAPPSSLPSVPRDSPKPADSSAHTGTYSCTYHGCTERFSTPQKLQRHKKDAHRRVSNVTPGIGSGMSSVDLAARNSQSGPHKCERINPTTNKPCNAIFSRPYDLTRHEDTIHNNRKQKVRCALCQEEKTFSRADALTRHLRVVHPEVDFPGKHRRRGGSPA